MSKQLEEALHLLLEGKPDEAKTLVHDLVVDIARKHHSKLIKEDENDFTDDTDDDMGTEFMGDDDLDSDDLSDEDEGDDIDNELDDIEDDEFDLESKIEELQAQMLDMKDKFDDVIDAVTDELDLDTDVEDEDELSDDEEEIDLEIDDDGVDLEVDDDEDLEEEFRDLEESVDLEPYGSVVMSDSTDISGRKFKSNTRSPIEQKKVGERAFKGKPIEIKSDNYTGFDREQAPSTQNVGNYRNNMKKATDDNSKVAAGGNPNALLNKTEKEFGGSKNASMIGSKGTRTGV